MWLSSKAIKKGYQTTLAAMMLFFVACNLALPTISDEGNTPNEPSTKETAAAKDLVLFNNNKPTGNPPDYLLGQHLTLCQADTDCGAGIPPNGGKQKCANIFGDATCFFPCNPEKGTGDRQNPDCLKPENCIRLSDNSGLCAYLPGQLYGTGSYGAIVRHAKGEKCLMRFGGCEPGTICVDDKRHGSIGTCLEECNPPALAGQPIPACTTPNTVCTKLASGFGACFSK